MWLFKEWVSRSSSVSVGMKSAALHWRPLHSYQVASEQHTSVLSHAAKEETVLEWKAAYAWGRVSSIAAEQWEKWQCCPNVGPRSIHFYYVFTLSVIFLQWIFFRLHHTDSFQQGAAFVHLWKIRGCSVKGSSAGIETQKFPVLKTNMFGNGWSTRTVRGVVGVKELAVGLSCPLYLCNASTSTA